MTVRVNVIVAASQVALARACTAGIAGPAGAGMFTTGLSPTGAAPATHYISSGHISDEMAALLRSPPAAIYDASQARTPPLKVTQQQITNLMAAVDLSDADTEGPFEAMARLGLQMVQEPLA
jgi:hypothetical protein